MTYFSIYGENIFLISNYDDDILQCINGMILCILGYEKNIKISDLEKFENIGITDNITKLLLMSNFIKPTKKHYFIKSFKFLDGVIYIFSTNRLHLHFHY